MLKHVYSCNICGEEISRADLHNAVGLHFCGGNNFTIGNYGCTENIHICAYCAVRLKRQLNSPQISNDLEKFFAANCLEQVKPPTTGGQSPSELPPLPGSVPSVGGK